MKTEDLTNTSKNVEIIRVLDLGYTTIVEAVDWEGII